MEYPRYHKELVGDLMNGKFILASDQRFSTLKDNLVFYVKFFKDRRTTLLIISGSIVIFLDLK